VNGKCPDSFNYSHRTAGDSLKRGLEEAKLLRVTNRKGWRDWLKRYYRTEKEVWLVYNRKRTGKPRILYNDAVEEALCFGWIDSRVRSVDEDQYAQRFSPRNPKAPYSQANKERLKELVKQGKVVGSVLATLGSILGEQFNIARDVLKAIKANKTAWENFRAFSQAYVRIRIAFIEGARNRPAEFRKRLGYFIEMTEKNRQFGFGGIEKYY
jgi:uncharacterized protein YdeI (YjbR/CyaY-like superfamily)